MQVVRVEWPYLAVFAIAVAAVAFFAYAVVTSQGVSRNVPVADLRAGGVDFVLGGVRFRETGFTDSPFPDGPSQVTFQVTFPDGAVEDLAFSFGGFCIGGSGSQASTVHRDPGAFLSYVCGTESVRVSVG